MPSFASTPLGRRELKREASSLGSGETEGLAKSRLRPSALGRREPDLDSGREVVRDELAEGAGDVMDEAADEAAADSCVASAAAYANADAVGSTNLLFASLTTAARMMDENEWRSGRSRRIDGAPPMDSDGCC